MNKYLELKNKQEKEFNNFPMKFAFGNEQFVKMMGNWGLKPSDTDQIICLSGTGGFILKKDKDAFLQMCKRHEQEVEEAIKNDTDGTGFIYEMFYYELANHEYCITYSFDDTLNALNMRYEDVVNNEIMFNVLKKAANDVCENCA